MLPAELGSSLAVNRALVIQGPVGTMVGEESLHLLLGSEAGARALYGVHEAYAKSGASFLVAHTFGAQVERNYMLNQSESQQEANIKRGVGIAKAVAEAYGIPVAASVSPVGDCYKPAEGLQLSHDEKVAVQRRMLRLVAYGGAQFVIAETYPSLHDILAFAEAADAEEVDYGISLYVVRSKVDGRLHLPYDRLRQSNDEEEGPLLTDAVTFLRRLPKRPGMIGTNCGDLDNSADAVADIRSASDAEIIVAYPNGDGVPDDTPAELLAKRSGQRNPRLTPALKNCLLGGAAIVGGCCRTGPEDTKALTELIGELIESGELA